MSIWPNITTHFCHTHFSYAIKCNKRIFLKVIAVAAKDI